MSDPQDGVLGFILRNMTGLGTILVSASVGLSGFYIARTNQKISAADACRERTLSLYDKATEFVEAGSERAPTASARAGARLAIDSQFVELTCDRAGMPVSGQLSSVLGEAGALLKDKTSRDLVESTARAAGNTSTVPSPPPSASSVSGVAAPGRTQPAAAPARLFIQISDERQRGGAEAMRASMLATPPVGWPLVVLPWIERAGSVGSNELRCLKIADCQRAKELAEGIARIGRLPEIKVVNLSRRYESRRDIRPGTYELWLAPDALAPTPKN